LLDTRLDRTALFDRSPGAFPVPAMESAVRRRHRGAALGMAAIFRAEASFDDAVRHFVD
jgi:hypothetical protein